MKGVEHKVCALTNRYIKKIVRKSALKPGRLANQDRAVAANKKGRITAPLFTFRVEFTRFGSAFGGLGDLCGKIFFDHFDAFTDFQAHESGDRGA